jgi:MscS family membrane protein
MRNWVEKIIFENPISDYLIVVSVLFLMLMLRKVATRKLVGFVFYLFSKKGKKTSEKEFLELVLRPLENFVITLTAYLAIGSLVFPKVLKFKIGKLQSLDLLEAIGTMALIYFFFQTLLRIIDYLSIVMEKKANETADFSDNQLVIFFREFLKVVVIILCILVIIRFVFNKDITKILAGLSLAGAAIALAAKESLENLIASFIIFFDKPFTVGDLLKVHQINGTVEKIGLRSTRIRTLEKTYVTIPNKQMVDSIVDNLTLRNKRRGELILKIDLKTTAAIIKNFIDEVDQKVRTLNTQDVTVTMSDIQYDAYVIGIEYFTEVLSIADFARKKQEVNLVILELLDAKGLKLSGQEKVFIARESS